MLNISEGVHFYTILSYLLISHKIENTNTNYLFQISKN